MSHLIFIFNWKGKSTLVDKKDNLAVLMSEHESLLYDFVMIAFTKLNKYYLIMTNNVMNPTTK